MKHAPHDAKTNLSILPREGIFCTPIGPLEPDIALASLPFFANIFCCKLHVYLHTSTAGKIEQSTHKRPL